MTTPTLDDLTTRILVAVVDGERSPQAIAQVLNVDRLVVYRRLHHLKDAGLVAWDPHKGGTLRALVYEVQP